MHVPQAEFMLFLEDSVFQIALQISLDKLETVARSFCTTAQESFRLEEVCVEAQSTVLSSLMESHSLPPPVCAGARLLNRFPHLPSCISRCFFILE